MSDTTLTPERITQLRGLGAYQGGLLKAELDALLDAAEELHAIENRAEKPTCKRCIKVRVHSLEDDRDRLASENATLRAERDKITCDCDDMDDNCTKCDGKGWFDMQDITKLVASRDAALAENTKLRRWLDAAEAKLERLEKTP